MCIHASVRRASCPVTASWPPPCGETCLTVSVRTLSSWSSWWSTCASRCVGAYACQHVTISLLYKPSAHWVAVWNVLYQQAPLPIKCDKTLLCIIIIIIHFICSTVNLNKKFVVLERKKSNVSQIVHDLKMMLSVICRVYKNLRQTFAS